MSAARTPQRVAVTEYGSPQPLLPFARRMGITPELLRQYLERAGHRIKAALGVEEAISFGDGTFQVVDVAGLLRLAPGFDLEIRPKFLAGQSDSWREDFFCIATISRYGRVLPRESLSAATGTRGDLADLLARAMVHMYDQNHRRPLRTYRHRTWRSLEIDGDVDPESVALCDEDGFTQQGLVLDRENPFNRVIELGMSSLLPEVRNGDTRRRLAQRLLQLSPQRDGQRTRSSRLPSRHRRWQDLFDLAQQVCAGYGLSYGDRGHGPLPGFLVRTVDAWESLVLTALRIGLPAREVSKRLHPFGRQSRVGQVTTKLSVEPDVSVVKAGTCALLIDAKYKTRTITGRRDQGNMSRSDVYEAVSFMRAAGCNRTMLVYPAIEQLGSEIDPGSAGAFERIVVETMEIVGLAVDPRGVAEPEGFGKFCRRLAANIQAWEC